MDSARSPDQSAFTCPSCGTESSGRFCRNCGEQKLGSEDRSFRHYLDVLIGFLTHFDSKGYRTLWSLLTKPGYLSAEQLRGSRVRYVKPLSLFISINVVYYFSIAVVAYLVPMLRRVYGVGQRYCVPVALALAWSFFHIVFLYRFVLFVITLHVV